MKLPPAKFAILAAMACFGLSVCTLFGQVAPTTPDPKEEATIKLDPFSVSADSDVGFVAASSLAGGRIATALKDTPVAYSVITKEFLEAFNLTDVVEASAFTVSASSMDGDGSQRQYGRTDSSQLTLRGVKVGAPQVNYFNFQYTADAYNLDRVDFARGPNSVLFGAGGVAGTVNSITKQANPSREMREVRVQVGSFNRFRFTADVNQPLNANIAVRANILLAQGETWRDYEWDRKYGLHFAATYKITPKLTFRGEIEHVDRNESRFTMLKDTLSAWDGRTYDFVAPLTGTGAPTNTFLATAGIQRRTPMKWVAHPDFGPDPVNFQNTFESVGARYNTTANLSNLINGVRIGTVGFNLGGSELIGTNGGVPLTTRYASVLAGSPYFNIPNQEKTTMWDDNVPTFNEKTITRSLYLTYVPRDDLFVELAWNLNHTDINARSNVRDGLNDVRMDIVRTLPNGMPNVNFLRPYTEFWDQRVYKIHTFNNLRAQAVYRKESRIGRLQFGVMAGQTRHHFNERGNEIKLPMKSIRADARGWTMDVEQSQFTHWTRFYVDETYRPFDPDYITSRPLKLYNQVNGITEIVQPTYMYDIRREERQGDGRRRFQFVQAAGNLDLFKNRLVLIGAVRRDMSRMQQLRFLQANKMPAGWDGTYLTYRPLPPDDYYELTYVAKDATGKVIGTPDPAFVRPTSIVNGIPTSLPQYANDRFRDDYSIPVINNNLTTYTTGAVVNIRPWLGVYGNVSETFDLAEPYPLIDGQLGKITTSDGKDYGVRVTLPNGKMSFSFGGYRAYQVGARVSAPGGFTGAYTSIASAPVVGDLSEGGANIRGLRRFTFAVQSTVTSEINGYESELTANFTPGWRMTLNVGKTKAVITDRYPEVIQYAKDTEPILRQILADSGVIIGTDNVAQISPALNDPTKINQVRVQSAVDAWNNLQQNIMPNTLGTRPQLQEGQVPWVANLATDYRFRSGRLKGLRAGIGVNYRGGQIVGFRASDTMLDPNNPTLAIDDPSVDQYTPVYSESYYKATGTLSYTVTLKESKRFVPKTIQFDLLIDNLLNLNEPIYGTIAGSSGTASNKTVPRNGDFTSPARVTVPGNPRFIPPRNWMLTAKMNF